MWRNLKESDNVAVYKNDFKEIISSSWGRNNYVQKIVRKFCMIFNYDAHVFSDSNSHRTQIIRLNWDLLFCLSMSELSSGKCVLSGLKLFE